MSVGSLKTRQLSYRLHGSGPFTGISGGELSYARENNVLAPAVLLNDCSNVVDQSPTATSVTFPILDFISRYQICFKDQDRYQYPNNLDSTAYALAVRHLLYAYFEFLDAAPGLGGLQDQMDPARNVDMSGGALTLDCMDDAYHRVVSNEGRPTVIMTSSRGLRTYQSICRASGYEPPKVPIKWYDPAKQHMNQSEAPAFNGTPILINDMMAGAREPNPEAQRIWFLVLGDDGGSGPTRGVHAIIPENLKSSMFVKRETFGAPDPDVQGDVRTKSDVWVSWPVGLATASQGAISLISNFAPVGDCAEG